MSITVATSKLSCPSLRLNSFTNTNGVDSELGRLQCGMCYWPVPRARLFKRVVQNEASGCSDLTECRYQKDSSSSLNTSVSKSSKQKLQLREVGLEYSSLGLGRDFGYSGGTGVRWGEGWTSHSGVAGVVCSGADSMGVFWDRVKSSRVGPRIARAMGVEQARMGLVAKQLQAVLQGEGKLPSQWDVVGLGQAMVDFSGVVGDEFLEQLHLEKGVRKVVDLEERGRVLKELDGQNYKLRAGGSLSNTLGALAQLGAASRRLGAAPPLNVGIWGSVGGDAPGDFYRSKLEKAGVHFLSKPISEGTTGTVVVLTTPDAQRTMLAYQGTSSTVVYSDDLKAAISRTSIFVAEGYLLEIPQTIETVCQACAAARSAGAIVALTASDVSCVNRHFDDFWRVLRDVDVLFSNADEANALAGFLPSTPPSVTAKRLSRSVRLVSVTDGARGSYLAYKGNVVYIEPSQCTAVDTCGAGDAYAAGLLYAVLRGRGAEMLMTPMPASEEEGSDTNCSSQDAIPVAASLVYHEGGEEKTVAGNGRKVEELELLESFGKVAAKVAAVVVAQQGPRLKDVDAESLVLAFGAMPCMEGRWMGGGGSKHPFGMGLGI